MKAARKGMTRSPVPNHWTRRLMRTLIVPALPGLALACTSSGHLLGRAGGPGNDGGVTEAGAPADGARSCSGLGSPIRLPTAAGPICAAALAQRSHRFAMCTCESVAATARINTDAFDSTGADLISPAPAAIGIDGDLQSSTIVQAFGSIHVAGAGGIATSDRIVGLGSLHVAGPMRAPGAVIDIAGDAYAGGDVQGFLIVAGKLHVDPRADLSLASITADDTVEETVSVPPPCDCAPGVVDIAAAIASATASNDNAAIGLTGQRLAAVTASTVIDLPCGSYALTSIDAQQALFFAVHGRALVAVAGDVVLRGGLTVTLDPGAELDLLVGGRLLASGGNPIGSVAPARFRLWMAGTQSLVLDDDPTVGAVIHAPRAELMASGGVDLSGGVLARSISAGGTFNLHFDQAVLSAGGPCGEPTSPAVP
jgi:hypothetical protein